LTKSTFKQINDQNHRNLYYDNKNNFNHHDEVTSDTEDIISDEEWGEVNSKSKSTNNSASGRDKIKKKKTQWPELKFNEVVTPGKKVIAV